MKRSRTRTDGGERRQGTARVEAARHAENEEPGIGPLEKGLHRLHDARVIVDDQNPDVLDRFTLLGERGPETGGVEEVGEIAARDAVAAAGNAGSPEFPRADPLVDGDPGDVEQTADLPGAVDRLS